MLYHRFRMPRCSGHQKTINDLSNLKAKLIHLGRNDIEECLVQWMCTTGEMRNHQAVGCHFDGNNSHPLEIYSVFNRTQDEQKDA